MKIGIVSHDSGGAELLSSYVYYNKSSEYIFYLKGSSIKIFRKKIKNLKLSKKLFFFSNINILLFSTGWKTDFEIKALIEAKKKNIKTICFLDHWANYKERFLYKNKIYLPDEIWVADKYAEKKAKLIFSNIKVVLKKNYYFYYLKKNYKISRKFKKNTFLYLCDPKRKNNCGYTEKDSFYFFIKNIRKISQNNKYQIYIRKHPSQKKCSKFFFFNKNIKPSNENNLIKDIKNYEFIVGSGSIALIVADKFGKKVYSSIPPNKIFLLPRSKIKLIRDL
jgi:hypothetical protein